MKLVKILVYTFSKIKKSFGNKKIETSNANLNSKMKLEESLVYTFSKSGFFDKNTDTFYLDIKIEKTIKLILTYLNGNEKFEKFDFEKHKNCKKLIFVKPFDILKTTFEGNTKIQKIPFIDIIEFDKLENHYLNNKKITIEKVTKMVSIGLSEDNKKPHWVFTKKDHSYEYYILLKENVFVEKK